MEENSIKLTDLRVGNLVYLPKYKIGATVVSVDGRDIIKLSIVDELKDYTLREIEGIELTEDWLIGFGFSGQERKEAIWFDAPFRCNFYFDLPYNLFRVEDRMLPISKKCHYVHDLQNIFYFLTGKELTLKK